MRSTRLLCFFSCLLYLLAGGRLLAKDILNASYDPTRELYEDINRAFATDWKARHAGETVSIKQSHGGSGKQARAVLDGLEADVVSLALAYDVDVLADKKLLPSDWQKRLPHNAAPYTSTIVFLVRKGNPKQIRDWSDLSKEGISVVTPNPKTSGGARWNYLAAWGYALKKEGTPEAAKKFVAQVYKNVKVLDTGARGSTTSFAQRGIGDVLITWENEAQLTLKEFAGKGLEIVVPSRSVLAEPVVALVDKVSDRKGTRPLAEAYLQFLYTEPAQQLIAKHHFRPRSTAASGAAGVSFPAIELFTVEEVFGGWRKAQKEHFDEGGSFDQIFASST